MGLIDVQNISFSYENNLTPIFENLNLQLDTNWKLGLIGRNGYGKTTFLKILQGFVDYNGKIIANIEFEYFPYQNIESDLICLNLMKKYIKDVEEWEIEKELRLIDLNTDILNKEFRLLSSGEKTKFLIVMMFLKSNKFMLIDEPTNHLDIKGRQILAKYLKSKKGFIIVSHDRTFLNQIIDHVLSIEKNNIVLQKGNFDTWMINKDYLDALEIEANSKLRKEIRRLKQSAREKAQWADRIEKTKIGSGPVDRGYIGHKSAKMMKRAKTLEKRMDRAIQDKSKLLKNVERIDPLAIECEPHFADPLIVVHDFSLSYTDELLFNPIRFTLNQGDVIILIGKNGSGKSSILKYLLGEEIKSNGEIHKASKLKVSYLQQTFSHLNGSIDNYIEENNIDPTKFLTLLIKLGFTRDQFLKNLEEFSDGQKKKVLIATSLSIKAHLYLWDEPLNYLDVISRMQLEEMILRAKPTMIIVEHDEKFIDNIATDVIELSIKNKVKNKFSLS